MNERWSLDNLYTSLESDKFKKDLKELKEVIKSLDDLSNNLNEKVEIDKILEFVKIQTKMAELSTLGHYVSLTLATDVNNSDFIKMQDVLDDIYVSLTVPEVKFARYLSKIDNWDEVLQNKTLNDHSFFLKEISDASKYMLDDKTEHILAKMKNTGSNAFSKLRDALVSNLTIEIEIDGKVEVKNFPEIRNMAYSDNSGLRKNAYESELKAYKKIDTSMASCLNSIKGEVINISKERGYASPLEKTVLDSRMDLEILNTMFEAIDEYMPELRKYFIKKAEMLGYDNGLPFYDLFAPIGENINFTYDEAAKYIIDNFNGFHSELGDYAKKAFDNQWIDATPMDSKMDGAFCDNIIPIGESRILSNFEGSFSDVSTLAHEIGHGFHGECLKGELILNTEYPMPIAETASIFCETIIEQSALKNATDEEKLFILDNSLTNATQVIVDIYSRFLFEDEVFNRREESSLSVDDLCEIMKNAQLKTYGNGLDKNYLHKYMWAAKPHYYDGDYNYYNFPYAFGLLFAKGVYAIYKEEPNGFIDKYKELLSITGKENIYDVCQSVGIDVKDINFWRKSLETVKEDVYKFMEL